MSSKLASLKVKITANGAQATKELKSVEKKAKDVAKSMKKIGSTLTKHVTGPLAALAAVSVKTANTQMQAEAKLLNALKGREDVQKRLIAQAAELQGRSLFGDEEIINQQAVLAAMGRTEQQINDIIEASAQLSAATGMSLDSAVKNLAKTYGGLAGKLGESIPALRELTKEQLQNGDAVKLINEQYKGFAETAAQTGAGPLVQLKNKLGDLSEQIGIILMPILDRLVEILTKIVDWFSSLDKETQKSIVNWGLATAALGPLVSSFGSFLTLLGNFKTIAPSITAAIGSMVGPLAAVAGAIASIISLYKIFDNMREGRERQQWQTGYMRASAKYGNSSDADIQTALASVEDSIRNWESQFQSDRFELGKGDEIAKNVQQLQGERDALNEILDKRAAISAAEKAGAELTAAITAESQRLIANTNGGLAEADGLIGKLTARISELQSKLPWAKSTEEIAAMNAEIERLQGELRQLQELKPTQNVITDGVAAVNPMFNADGFMSPISKVKVRLSETWKLWQEFNNNMEHESQRSANIGAALGEAIGRMAERSLTSLGEMLGNLMSMPEQGMDNPLATILQIIGSGLREIGAALIAYSEIVAKVKAALAALWTAPGGAVAAIAIGVGAIAAGTALMNQAAKLPKLAKGGLAYAPTLAMVGDNPGAASDPEVIAPLSKLRNYMGGQQLQLVGNVAFELHGDVARAVLNRENIRLSRLG